MAKVKGATEDGLEATRARRKTWHDESISFREQTRIPFMFHDQLCDRTHGVYIPSYVTKVCFPLVDGTCQGLPFHFRTCFNMPLSSTISRLHQQDDTFWNRKKKGACIDAGEGWFTR